MDDTFTSPPGPHDSTGDDIPPPPPGRPLTRSRSDRKLAGVCGGVADWLGIDPLVLRVVVAVLAVFGGSGVLLYGLGWLLLPEEGRDESSGQRLLHGKADTSAVIAIGAVIVGIGIFGGLVGNGPDSGVLVLLTVLAVGFVVAVRQGRVSGPEWLSGPGSPPPWSSAPRPAGVPTPPPPVTPDSFGRSTGTAYSVPRATTYAEPDPTGYPPAGGYPPPAPPGRVPYGPPPPPPAPKTPRERSVLGRLTFSLALLTAGGLVAYRLATGDGPSAEVVIASALAVVGLGLVIGAYVGRARGLIALGIVLNLALAATAAFDVPVNGGIGERTWRPASVSELQDSYALGMGDAVLDLTALPPSGIVSTEARLGIGHLVVRVPRGATVEVHARAGAGDVALPDRLEASGWRTVRDVTLAPDPAPAAGTSSTIKLHAVVCIGQVEVLRAAS